MKKAANWLCALAFVLVCALVLGFFTPLMETGGAIPMLEWESAAVTDADGRETPFDMFSAAPGLEEGESYRFTVTLPARDALSCIVLDGGAGLSELALDGEVIYASRAGELTSSLRILLPEGGGGETLTLDFVPEGETGVFPPILQLTDEASDERDSMAYANHYAIPAGAMALTLVLLCGLFLLGLAGGRPDWRLLTLIFAAAILIADPLCQSFGNYFFPGWLIRLFNWGGWEWLAALALLAYLALHRSRRFWALWGVMTAVSAVAILLCWGVSYLRGEYLAKYISSLFSELSMGYFSNLLYWLTGWLAMVCTLLSACELLRSYTSARAEARALALKNHLVMENYRSIEAKLREGAALRHEISHRLAVMDAYVQSGDYEALARSLGDWRSKDSVVAVNARFTENIAVNAMLQDAASRAEAAGIEFAAAAVLPRELPIPEADLCALLMNMLDNAVEGASRTPDGQRRRIHVQLRASGGFLAISCVNSFDGRVNTDERGAPLTTKPDPEYHGFGLSQMRAVAEKYGSILDLSWDRAEFTVQTALKI